MHERWGPRAGLALAVLATVGLAGLPACRSNESGADTTVPSPTTTTEPDDGDPWAIPATIDEPYVQRVLDELARIEGEALREIVREQGFTERALVLLGEIYTEEELASQLVLIQDALDDDLEGVKVPPGDPVYRLLSIRSSSETCVFATLHTDLGEVLEEPNPEPPVEFVTLRRSSDARLRFNESAWLIDELLFFPDIEEDNVEDGCDAR